MTNYTPMMARVERLVQQAQADHRTRPMVRGYLNRAFNYARTRREPELMRFVCEQEKAFDRQFAAGAGIQGAA